MNTSENEPIFVRDLMTVGVATCPPDASIMDVARLLLNQNLDELVVLDGGHAVGVIGQTELVGICCRQDSERLSVKDVMREDVPQVPADIPLQAAMQIMLDRGIRSLYLMHHAAGIEYPAGKLTFQHLLRFLVAEKPDDISDLGIHAARKSPVEMFIQRRDEARKLRGQS